MLKKILLNSVILLFSANLSAADKNKKKKKIKKEADFAAAFLWTTASAGMGYVAYLTYKLSNPEKFWDKQATKWSKGVELEKAKDDIQKNVILANQHLPLVFWPAGCLFCAYKAIEALQES